MIVLGIDPGFGRCGIAVVDGSTKPETVIYSWCVEPPKDDLNKRIIFIIREMRRLIDEYNVEACALETLYFQSNKKTAIDVAQLRGALLLVAAEKNLQLFEYTPQQIKVAVTGYGQSAKQEVTSMVKRLAKNVRNGALDDEYDAIAVALTCLASEKFSNSIKKAAL